MNSVICAVIAYYCMVLAMNSVTGLRGRELVTAVCSFRSGSAGGLNAISRQKLKDLISRSGSAGGLDVLRPQNLKDLISRSGSAGDLDVLRPQDLKDLILRTGSTGSSDRLNPQDLKDLILRSGSTGGLDRLSPQDLKDLDSWSNSPGISDGLSPQQLMDLICSGDGEAGDLKLQITRTPFEFGYEQRDLFLMDISFKLPSDVTGGFVSLRYSLTDHHPKSTFEIRRPYDETDDPAVQVRDFISGERVYIDVHLFNKTGVRLNKRISEGSVVKKYRDYTRQNECKLVILADSPICLNGNRCQMKVDLRKECEDAEIVEKSTFKYILFISLSILFAVALCVLLIVAFIKRCWIKRVALEIVQVPLQPKDSF